MGDFSLFYVPAESALFVGGDKSGDYPSNMELFGFGSGELVDGATAQHVLSDEAGRFFRVQLQGLNQPAIFEPDRKLPQEIKNLAIWNKAIF